MAKFDKFDYNRLLEDNGTQVVDIIRYNENFELVSMDIHFLNSGEGEFRLDINEIKALLRKSGTVWFKNIGFTATKDKKTGEYRYYWSGTGNGKRNTAFKINLRIDEDIESDLEKLYKYRNFRLKKVYYYDNKSINQVCTTRSTIITKAVFSITENGQSKEIELSAKDILRQLRFDRNSRFMTDADLDLFNVKDGGAIELNILKKGIPDLGSIPNLGVIIEQDREAARWQNEWQ
jgi:hypothetical protein